MQRFGVPGKTLVGMEETQADEHTCSMPETDNAGHPNLCCCYLMDAFHSIRRLKRS
jgi:hypothetical protein